MLSHPGRIAQFSKDKGLAGSASVWGTVHALKFRNPEKVSNTQKAKDILVPNAVARRLEITKTQKRGDCESLGRRIAVEFIAIPVLIVASLVEGVVRGALGLTLMGLGFLASQCSETLADAICPTAALEYLALGGFFSLCNTVNLAHLLWTNIAQGSEKVRYKELVLGMPV